MVIENSLSTAKLKLFYVIGLITALASTGIYFFNFNRPTANVIILTTISIIVILYIGALIIRLNYLYFYTDDKKILLRYYSAHPFLRKYKAFEIPIAFFYSYKIETSFFGLKRELYLVAKNNKKTFNYPSVSLSLYNKKKMITLIKLLDKLDSKS